MKRLLFTFVAVVTILVLTATVRPASARPQPLVLAFYYAWFDQNIWDLNKVADLPTLRYLSNDPTTIARQIQLAQNAGIDVFVVSWWGAGNPTDVNFRSMLDVSSAVNFKTAVDFEVTSPFYKSRDDVVNSLKNLLATHVNHPAYLRVDGKPVIFFWSDKINDFTLKYSVDDWKAIRDQVDPNHQTIWVAEGIDWTYLRVFDGLHLYSIAWSPNVFGELAKWPRRVKSFGADKLWVATVMPGNDDRKTRRPGSYARDRENGNFYRQTWQAALATNPEWVIITSWNEWVEGTMIEPSVTYGNLYLDITREYAGKFKSGLPLPAPTPTASPTLKPSPTPVQIAVATPDSRSVSSSPTQVAVNINPSSTDSGISAKTTDALRVRADPNSNATILGRYAQGVSIPLFARTDDGAWFQTQVPASDQRGWVSRDFLTLNGSAGNLPTLQGGTVAIPTPTATAVVSVPDAVPSETIDVPTSTPAPTPTHVLASSFSLPTIQLPFRLPFFP